MCDIIERERKEIQTERIKIYEVICKQRKIIEGSDISKIVILTEIQKGKVFIIKRFPFHSFDTSVCKLRTQLIKRPFLLSGYSFRIVHSFHILLNRTNVLITFLREDLISMPYPKLRILRIYPFSTPQAICIVDVLHTRE